MPRVRDDVDAALAQLPGLFRILGEELHPAMMAAEPVSGSRSPGLPLRVGHLALQQDLAQAACRWEDAVRAAVGHAERLRHLPGHSYLIRGCLPALVYLRGHAGDLRTLPDGEEAIAELIRLRDRIVRALGLAPLVHRLPVPCPTCEGQLLRRDGEEKVICAECRRIWEWVDYQWLVAVTVHEMPA